MRRFHPDTLRNFLALESFRDSMRACVAHPELYSKSRVAGALIGFQLTARRQVLELLSSQRKTGRPVTMGVD
jgi:hypothetical protein